ncbi:unnamed protein product [Didymodactylos carnosus]|uniref:Uncharacterized protein n=1 Tax=Didymodactylos carnosus TaxID=1234261 RepID=A0A813TKE1_9BILA|nr:unnamed protein product [Didymodactylos carnosus]CAF3598111.1 unnamed protein product [Didymodactylos carnosus]
MPKQSKKPIARAAPYISMPHRSRKNLNQQSAQIQQQQQQQQRCLPEPHQENLISGDKDETFARKRFHRSTLPSPSPPPTSLISDSSSIFSSLSSSTTNSNADDDLNYWLSCSIREVCKRIPINCLGYEFLSNGEVEVIENNFRALSVILSSSDWDLERNPVDYVRAFRRLHAIDSFILLCENFLQVAGDDNNRYRSLIQLIGQGWYTCLAGLLPSCLFPLDTTSTVPLTHLTNDDSRKLHFINQNISDFEDVLDEAIKHGECITKQNTYSQYPILLNYVRKMWLVLKEEIFSKTDNGKHSHSGLPLRNLSNNDQLVISNGRLPLFCASKQLKMLSSFISQFFQSSSVDCEQSKMTYINDRQKYNFNDNYETYTKTYLIGNSEGDMYDITTMKQWQYEQLYRRHRQCKCTRTQQCCKTIEDKLFEISHQ